MQFFNVAVPVPVRRQFTYAADEALGASIQPGSRVLVPFGQRQMVGVVTGLADTPAVPSELRTILGVLDDIPALSPTLLQIGEWVSQYYLAPPGEVFQAMLPPALELDVARRVVLTPAGYQFLQKLGGQWLPGTPEPAELVLLREIEAGRVTKKARGQQPVLASLLRRGLVTLSVPSGLPQQRYRVVVAWRGQADPMGEREQRVASVLTMAGPLSLSEAAKRCGVTTRTLRRLIETGRLEAWKEPLGASVEAPEADTLELGPPGALTPEQASAVQAILQWLQAGQFVTGLLFGVTGSGKTEVYLRAVQHALALGRSALILVPEIALTYPVGRQARARFGDCVAVLHSGLGARERWEQWWRIRRGEVRVVVGTRLAVFAPLQRLGLIVVDEEQEASYKQEETPRYHGRDTALMRARIEGAVALLGSATPSLETFSHAMAGRYRLLELPVRVEGRPLPSVEVVDLREEFRRSGSVRPISERLCTRLRQCLHQGHQALVLINRRGYAWFVLCRACGGVLECRHCSIALTYHKRRQRLLCHYCGYTTQVPARCPRCQSEHLHYFGEGSERIEEYLREQLDGFRVARLDRDTVRGRQSYRRVLDAFARGDIHVLVGTQMIAKGHDFQRVALVGVLGIDRLLSMPDFRAAERAFQLLTQVAGRAGRGPVAGAVLVETYHPEHYAIVHAVRQDMRAFFEQESRFRRMLQYPPAAVLANLIVRHRQLERATAWTRTVAAFWTARGTGIRVLGPAPAPLARLRREYRFQFLLKSSQRMRLVQLLDRCLQYAAEQGIPESALVVDMDPVTLL